jgi:hypothetical protein
LRSWRKKKFGAVTSELEALRAKLEDLKGNSFANRTEIRRVIDNMEELLYREEMMWLQ